MLIKKYIRNKYFQLLILFSFIFLINGVSAVTLSLTPFNQTVAVNDIFEINITVSDVIDLYGFQLDIKYDSILLEYVSIAEGNFLKKDGASTFELPPNTSTSGILKNYIVTRISAPKGINGSGDLATIKFKAKKIGIAKVGIFNTQLVNSDVILIPHITINATVNIQEFAMCGNNKVETGEVCDGTDLDGKTCVILGYDEGSLGCCSNCTAFDFFGCKNVDLECIDRDSHLPNPEFVFSNVTASTNFTTGPSCTGETDSGNDSQLFLDTCRDASILLERICNADGTSGTKEFNCENGCENGRCKKPTGCLITNASWNPKRAQEGQTVNILLEGTNCFEQELNITIMEYDVFSRDDILESFNVNYSASIPYVAKYIDDEYGLPDFYMRIEYLDRSIESGKKASELLKVRPSKREFRQKTINLKSGKNEFTMPLITDNMSIEEVFKNVRDNANKIYTYNAVSKRKIYHFNQSRPSNFNKLREGEGYVLFMNQDAVLQINGTKSFLNLSSPKFDLKIGWTLLSIFYEKYSVDRILGSDTENKLYMFNKATREFEEITNRTQVLYANESYWAYLVEDRSFSDPEEGLPTLSLFGKLLKILGVGK